MGDILDNGVTLALGTAGVLGVATLLKRRGTRGSPARLSDKVRNVQAAMDALLGSIGVDMKTALGVDWPDSEIVLDPHGYLSDMRILGTSFMRAVDNKHGWRPAWLRHRTVSVDLLHNLESAFVAAGTPLVYRKLSKGKKPSRYAG